MIFGQHLLDALARREAPPALLALAAAADLLALARHARVDHAVLVLAAVGAAHAALARRALGVERVAGGRARATSSRTAASAARVAGALERARDPAPRSARISASRMPARGGGRRADAHARGHRGLARVEGHHVLVGGDAGALERDARAALPVELAARPARAGTGGCRCRPTRCGSRAPRAPPRARARSRAICARSRGTRAAAPRRKATALAAITCMSGPPCPPGKTAVSIAFANRASHRIMPPRGPRSVLCVVVPISCAWPTGLGWSPAATSPAMCAMSAKSSAPTSSAISRKRVEVEHARVGRGAARIIFGRCSLRERAQLVVVDRLGRPAARRRARSGRACPRSSPGCRASGGRRGRGSWRGSCRPARAPRGRRTVGLRARVRLHVHVVGAEELLARSIARFSASSSTSQPP